MTLHSISPLNMATSYSHQLLMGGALGKLHDHACNNNSDLHCSIYASCVQKLESVRPLIVYICSSPLPQGEPFC